MFQTARKTNKYKCICKYKYNYTYKYGQGFGSSTSDSLLGTPNYGECTILKSGF
jgi:hypothetical protein